jgi:hypothetical protein
MPYKLGDRTLKLDVPWEHNDIQYPANWLRLSTAQDRAELGIVWGNDNTQPWNQKFYWGYDSDGNLIPKTYTDLKTLWIAKTKDTAYKLLQPSDYLWPKLQDENSSFAAAKTAYAASPWSTWRSTIRTECQTMVTAIEATADVGDTAPHADFGRVQALQQYIEGGSYNVWTADPDQPVATTPTPTSTPEFDSSQVSSGF